MDLLKQNGVEPVLAVDWPKKAETLARRRRASCSSSTAPKSTKVLKENRVAKVQKLMDEKVGLVQLTRPPTTPRNSAARPRVGRRRVGEGRRARALGHGVHHLPRPPDLPRRESVQNR